MTTRNEKKTPDLSLMREAGKEDVDSGCGALSTSEVNERAKRVFSAREWNGEKRKEIKLKKRL